jgi:FAD/FMN-containing dehydrogenase
MTAVVSTVPGSAEYESARRVWNRAVDRRPAVIVRCANEQDVVAAVLSARERGLPLSVRAGGHDWAGRAVRDGGVVVDLSPMTRITVACGPGDEPQAVVGGGVRAGDLAAAAQEYEMVAVVGTVSEVGVAGLTLGGGYGALIGRYGLALDNLTGARVVLADGRCADANADENPDLFWALRGGGGNFGVVTEMRLLLRPVRTVRAGMVAYPIEEAAGVLRGLNALPRHDELSVIAGLFTGQDGPMLALLPAWCGAPGTGEPALTELTRLGRPLAVQLDDLTPTGVLRLMDTNVGTGRAARADSRWLPDLTDDAIETIVAAARTVTSPYSVIALHHFHGAACRVPAGVTAWALRTEHRQVEIIASWPAEEREDRHRDWVARLSTALAPSALPGGYPNLLGPGELARVRLAHGANLGRLVEVKRKFDPDGVFTAVAAVEHADSLHEEES